MEEKRKMELCDMIDIKIIEEEWEEKGFQKIMEEYDFADIMDYFAFVELPKFEKAMGIAEE